MTCCVYQIKHRESGRVYVGSTVHLRRRWEAHRYLLRRGTHHSLKLQRAWDKYGEESFEFSVLLYCSPEMRHEYEQRFIDGWQLVTKGWNCSKNAKGPAVEFTQESREKMSASHRAIAKKHEWEGQYLCIAEIAEKTGVNAKKLDKRVNECGWDVAKAVRTPIKARDQEFTGFGKSQTISRWVRELAFKGTTLRTALNAGQTIEQIVANRDAAQKRVTITELARLAGLSKAAVMGRVRRGWDVGDALMVAPGEFVRRQHMRNAKCSGARELSL